jgi:hypothetical protein
MYSKIRRLSSILTILLLAACAAPALTPSEGVQAGAQRLVARSQALTEGGQSTAALFVSLTTRNGADFVAEYSRSDEGEAQPIRIVRSRGAFIGTDKSLNLYSVSYGSGGFCPCRVFVQDVTGRLLHSFTPPGGPGAYYFVTTSGSLYYSLQNCSQIYQLGAITKNRAPQVVRKLNIPAAACVSYLGERPGPQFTVFVDRSGGIYLTGSHGNYDSAWYIWSPGASGNAKPARIVYGDLQYAGVQGVDSKGSIWTIGRTNAEALKAAWEYSSTARGRSTPTVVPLKGVTGLENLLIGQNNQIVYLGGASRSGLPFNLTVASPSGGRVVQSITLNPSYVGGSQLQSVSF